jgi:hypothetical protein
VYGSDNGMGMDSTISESVFSIPNIELDSRNIQQILSQSWLPHKYLFSLMWRIRLQRMIRTLEGTKS